MLNKHGNVVVPASMRTGTSVVLARAKIASGGALLHWSTAVCCIGRVS